MRQERPLLIFECAAIHSTLVISAIYPARHVFHPETLMAAG
jgi:hypothetical protein